MLFRSVGGDPVNATDPSGLAQKTDAIHTRPICPISTNNSCEPQKEIVVVPEVVVTGQREKPKAEPPPIIFPDPSVFGSQGPSVREGGGAGTNGGGRGEMPKPKKEAPKALTPSLLKRVLCSNPANATASSTVGILTAPRVAAVSRAIRGSIAVSRAIEGAQIGAEVGAFGGPVGIGIGLAVGIGTSLAITYAQERYCAK